jgi:TPR repeat protein
MRKTSFILFGAASAVFFILMSVAASLGEDGAITAAFALILLVPPLLVASAITGLIAFVRQRPRTGIAYLAIALPLCGLAAFAYVAFPAVRKPVLEIRAKAGDVSAQYELGQTELIEMFLYPRNTEVGFYWLSRAATNGHLAAQLDLGRFYLEKRNLEHAKFWLKPLADSKHDGWERLNARSDMERLLSIRSETVTHP